jgi:SAM-dependent methyltransferase
VNSVLDQAMAAAAANRRQCPACDRETEYRLLWEKNGSRVLRCRTCGLGAATQDGFAPGEYYNAQYFNSATKGGYPDYAASEEIVRAEFRTTIDRLRRVVPSGRLLEIGSAYGFFLLEAGTHYEVHGVEIAEEAAAFARARGLDVRSSGLTRQVLEEIGPVDVVVMLDVIEHLEDPCGTLRLCGEYLRPGGVMLLTTPDFASALARISGRHWRNMTPPHHLWYFTPASLGKMAASAGLAVAEIDHPWKRVPISLVLQLLGRVGGRQLPQPLLSAASRLGIAVNLFDTMRVVLRKATQ